MNTLLVPVDFSDTTDLLMGEVLKIARQFSARVILLHVAEPMATYVPVGATMDVIATVSPAPEAENLSAQQDRLTSIAKPLTAAGISVENIALVGVAVDDILEQAARRKADYIILASHGHGALYHLFSGSVVTGVLKRAHCPVIVVPARTET